MLEQRLREAVALGLTLAQVSGVTAAGNGWKLAKSTVNRRVLPVAAVLAGMEVGPLRRVPPIVLVDGV